MPIKFHHLHLKARNPEGTAAWYERAFGFTITEKSKRQTGDVFILCRTPDGTTVVISGEKDRRGTRARGRRHPSRARAFCRCKRRLRPRPRASEIDWRAPARGAPHDAGWYSLRFHPSARRRAHRADVLPKGVRLLGLPLGPAAPTARGREACTQGTTLNGLNEP